MRTSTRQALTFSFLCACSFAQAQTPPAFVGSWKVTWHSSSRPEQARLVISESGGTWKTAFPYKTTFNQCLGREVGIAFEEIKGDEARIRLKYAEALPGCADSTIQIRKLNENQMTGTRWGKTELTITRE